MLPSCPAGLTLTTQTTSFPSSSLPTRQEDMLSVSAGPKPSASPEMPPNPHFAKMDPDAPVLIPATQLVDGQQAARAFTAQGSMLSNQPESQTNNNTVTIAAAVSVLTLLLLASVGTVLCCWFRQRTSKHTNISTKTSETIASAGALEVTASVVPVLTAVPVMAIPVSSEDYKGDDGALRQRPFLSRSDQNERLAAQEQALAQSATCESPTECKLIAEEANSTMVLPGDLCAQEEPIPTARAP